MYIHTIHTYVLYCMYVCIQTPRYNGWRFGKKFGVCEILGDRVPWLVVWVAWRDGIDGIDGIDGRKEGIGEMERWDGRKEGREGRKEGRDWRERVCGVVTERKHQSVLFIYIHT